MDKQLFNPPGLCDPNRYYTHVVTVRGGKLVFVSGQVAFDEHRELVGYGDLAAQCREAFTNLKTALAAADAGPENVVKITIYVKGYKPVDLDAIEEGYRACFGEFRGFACTLIGVHSLARAGLLVEVDAIAAVE
jgi:enamine deaminase RidA (YjgF/YER057c/UK114 family)